MTRNRKPEPGYADQSAPAKPKLEPVICPRPVFDSVGEKLAYDYAVESIPRRPGEELLDWIKRVSGAARDDTARQLELETDGRH